MRDNNPRPGAEKLQMCRSKCCVTFYKCVDEPHRYVGNQKECDDLTAGSRKIIELIEIYEFNADY